MGYGVGRGGRPGHRPCPRGDLAGVLPTPAGGVVVAVGCTVLQMWRDGVPWALQVRVLRAPAVTGHVAIPDPPGQSVGVRTKEVRGSRGGPRPLEEGGPGPRPLVLGIPPRGGAWRHRTPPRAGGGSGAIRVMRWSPNSESWQNSNGNSAEPVSSRVAGSTVLPQRSGWRSSDRSWRTRLWSQPLWGMAS